MPKMKEVGRCLAQNLFFLEIFSLAVHWPKREIGVILGVKINNWSNQGSFVALYLVKLNISCTCLGDCHMAITYLYTLGGNVSLVEYLMYQFLFFILNDLISDSLFAYFGDRRTRHCRYRT